MKKKIILLLLVFILTGCNSSKMNEKHATCSLDSEYGTYESVKQIYVYDGDLIKSIRFEGIVSTQSKEKLDFMIESLNVALDSYNSIEGIQISFERIDDTTLRDIADYDLKKASVSTLKQIGLIDVDAQDAKVLSLKKTFGNMESLGFNCKLD